MTSERRRIGLEQEFLVVDEAGRPSERVDELLSRCAETALEEGLDPESFSEECATGMVEVKTSPADTLEELEDEYLVNVGLAVRAGRGLGLKLYPLATYPLPFIPSFRDEPRYELQIQTIGKRRFLDAGRCFGVHLHLEVESGVVDPVEVVSHDAPAAGVRELLSLYNLATALDPALISLTRSCPFYEGYAPGLAARTAFYRGSEHFGWDGVYSKLPELGGLQPYAKSAAELVERQVSGYQTWQREMDLAGIGSSHLKEMSGDILDVCWRPVRVSNQGTIELRGIDSNYPHVVFAVAALVKAAAERVTSENLTVEPVEGLRRFERDRTRLLVPDFEGVGLELFHAAATEGTANPDVSAYLDSVLEFAAPDERRRKYTDHLKDEDGSYRTTEAEILQRLPEGSLTTEEGLGLVREACDRLEERVVARDHVANPG